jgi:hypothetical protein
VKNFQEHPQSLILTDSLEPVLRQRYPEGDYAIGQDSGIYNGGKPIPWRKGPKHRIGSMYPVCPLCWRVRFVGPMYCGANIHRP